MMSWLKERGSGSLKRLAERIVLVHNLTQAIPWIIAAAASAGAATYGVLSQSDVILSASVTISVWCVLTLALNFVQWYLKKREEGWRRKADEREQELRLDAEKNERNELAITHIANLAQDPLVIDDSEGANGSCLTWLSSKLIPGLTALSPGVRVGLLQWSEGSYSVPCDAGVPRRVAALLPKECNRDFARYLKLLEQPFYYLPLIDDVGGAEREWLVAFPEDIESFDGPARAVFAVGTRILADARAGIEHHRYQRTA